METIKERLLIFLNYKNLGQTKFEKMCGISNGSISNVKNKFGLNTLQKIYRTFPELSQEWLEFGEGDMLNKNTKKSSAPLIPLLSGSLSAGIGNEVTTFSAEDYYALPIFSDRKVDFLIHAYGESMLPTINSGDLLACRTASFPFIIRPNEIYAISTRDDSFVKRVVPVPDSEELEIISDNKFYAPFRISRADIISIAHVEGVMCVKKF